MHIAPQIRPEMPLGAPAPQVDPVFRATDVRTVQLDRPDEIRLDDLKPLGERPTSKWGKRIVMALLGLCGAIAAAAWQHYGDHARAMAADWAPPFVLAALSSSDKPPATEQASTPAAETAAADQAAVTDQPAAQPAAPAQPEQAAAPPAAASPAESSQLQAMAQDLAAMSQQVEELKASIAQLRTSHAQMAREVAKATEARGEARPSEPNPRPRVTAAAPSRPAAAPARRQTASPRRKPLTSRPFSRPPPPCRCNPHRLRKPWLATAPRWCGRRCPCGRNSVARVEQSETRDCSSVTPDCASLHPGYEAAPGPETKSPAAS